MIPLKVLLKYNVGSQIKLTLYLCYKALKKCPGNSVVQAALSKTACISYGGVCESNSAEKYFLNSQIFSDVVEKSYPIDGIFFFFF